MDKRPRLNIHTPFWLQKGTRTRVYKTPWVAFALGALVVGAALAAGVLVFNFWR